jgi:N-acyl-D-aspartate/D-glutamate deacylase
MLRDACPQMRLKGRLQVGADADIVVLDPAKISDSASYVEPTRPSVGVRYLFVHGTPVVSNGELDDRALPGRPLRGRPR